MDEQAASWPAGWVRAGLETAILASLESAQLHGYAIAQRLERHGMGRLKGGSLYPVLARLEQEGLVEAVWQPGESGPGRKAYALTARGRAEQRAQLEAWQGLVDTLTGLAGDSDEGDA